MLLFHSSSQNNFKIIKNQFFQVFFNVFLVIDLPGQITILIFEEIISWQKWHLLLVIEVLCTENS